MKIAYLVSTALIFAVALASAATYFFHEPTIKGVRELGFPDFFRIQLAILKVIGAMILVAPFAPPQVKEWAYAGIGLFLVTAIVAHMAHGDPLIVSLVSFVFLVLLGVSNVCWHRLG